MKEKIVDLDTLIQRTAEAKAQGKKIVSTSGCFDLLHAGHVTYLEDAKRKGNILVVLLNSDISVQKLKGPERPIMPEEARAIVIAGLECVDYVCLFSQPTPCEIIARFKPDVVIKGGDYYRKHIPEMDTVAEYGGTVEYVSLVEGCSSTNIIEKIKNLAV